MRIYRFACRVMRQAGYFVGSFFGGFREALRRRSEF
jgi:hypothetical protein